MTSTQALLEQGLVGNPDALVQVRELHGDPNSGSGGRAYFLALAGGLSFEWLPDRGLDVGAAWFEGSPIAWRSPMASPGLAPSPVGWEGRSGGGLVLTCGLDNVGSPRGIYGQHGSNHDTRAANVVVERIAGNSEHGPGLSLRGTVDSVETFGRRVRMYREITTYADDPSLTIKDRIVNEGWHPAPVAILYHCNFGAPLLLPGTSIQIDAGARRLREESPLLANCTWDRYPQPLEEITEKVWEHTDLRTDDNGRALATVSSPSGVWVELSWNATALPRCLEWVFPARGCWALGVEPSNAPLFGPERDSEDAGMHTLGAGEELITGVSLRVGR